MNCSDGLLREVVKVRLSAAHGIWLDEEEMDILARSGGQRRS